MSDGTLQYRISEDPALVPSPVRMLEEADEVLEDWFAAGAEQATLLRLLAGVGADSRVVEIGCGYGRLAGALRRVLTDGEYLGIDVVQHKVDFLTTELSTRAGQFRFAHLDVPNGMYNPHGAALLSEATFPCDDAWADAVVAMAVFTHLLPEVLDRYLAEIARVLAPGGRALVSLYLLDLYHPDRRRPERYASDEFSFDHPVDGVPWMRTSDPDQPETMLAMTLDGLLAIAARHDLRLHEPARPGSWSGSTPGWTTGQDLVVLARSR